MPGIRRVAVRVRAEQAAPRLGARVKAALSFDAAARQRRQQQRQERQRQQQQVAPADPQQYSLQRALARPEAAAASACAFAVVAAAVFLQPHAALPLDAAAHSWVAAHTSPEWRYAVGELLISDAPVAFGFTLWVALTGAALFVSPRRATPTLLVSLFAYAAGAGFSTGSDAALVGALKSAFHRIRPSTEIHHTFSFPSGHTTAATFMVGAALVVLLPLVLCLLQDGPGGGSDRIGGAATRLPDGVVFATWGGAVAMTAAGRVLADCHWVSDTAAGAALGVGCVCALAWAVETTEHALGNSGRSSSKRDNVS